MTENTKTKKQRETIEIEGGVVFSNIREPAQYNGEQGSYGMTILIKKDDTEQLKMIADAAKKVLGLPKVNITQMGLVDGDKKLSKKTGDPVAPGYYQLQASHGKQSAPKIIDKFGRPVSLEWEPGTDANGNMSTVALALSVSDYEKEVDNGMVKNKVRCASFWIRKVMLLNVHPYESNDDYEFTRFGEKPAQDQPQAQAPNAADTYSTVENQEVPETGGTGTDGSSAWPDEDPEF